MGGDPHPGTRKVLSVEYEANGKSYTATFDEGKHVVLP